MKLEPEDRELIDAAIQSRSHAYAPYSQFRVGAAVRTLDGRIATGVNVENCSYGLTVCAERHAVAAAVQAGMQAGQLIRVAIVAEAKAPTPPCGACRQVLGEFAAAGAVVLAHNVKDGKTTQVALTDLLPSAFRPDNIPKP